MGGKKKKIVVLHSGGMDSTVCVLFAKEMGYEVLSLGLIIDKSLLLNLIMQQGFVRI